jgi:Double-stranded RNA binding motif
MFYFTQGLDVAEANAVISYNHMKDSVELCQRFGRARQTDCSLVVLEERKDRPVQLLRHVESIQENIIGQFDPNKIDKKRYGDTATAAQRQREIQAAMVLQHDNNNLLKSSGNSSKSYVSVLNEYRQKTKANLGIKEEYTQLGTYIFHLTYSTPYRCLTSQGAGKNKKEAHQEAAKHMIEILQQV